MKVFIKYSTNNWITFLVSHFLLLFWLLLVIYRINHSELLHKTFCLLFSKHPLNVQRSTSHLGNNKTGLNFNVNHNVGERCRQWALHFALNLYQSYGLHPSLCHSLHANDAAVMTKLHFYKTPRGLPSSAF